MEDSFNDHIQMDIQHQVLRTPEQITDDSVFRSPSISTRGRKRKPVYTDDGVEISPTVSDAFFS
jgi:hypothetical protein